MPVDTPVHIPSFSPSLADTPEAACSSGGLRSEGQPSRGQNRHGPQAWIYLSRELWEDGQETDTLKREPHGCHVPKHWVRYIIII